MKCRQYREWIQDSFEGGLVPGQEEALRAHLPACPDCRRALLSLQDTIALLEEAPPVPLTKDFASLVLERIACERERPAAFGRWLFGEGGGLRPVPLFLLWTGLGLVLLWGIGLWTGQPPEEMASPFRFLETAGQWARDPAGISKGLIRRGRALWETLRVAFPAVLFSRAVFYLLLAFLLDLALIASGVAVWLRRKSLSHRMLF